MSWAEVGKINSNMKRSLNDMLRDMMYRPMRIITETGTYTPEKTGIYKVICIGAGGKGGYSSASNTYGASSGAGGGVAVKNIRLTKNTSYAVTVSSTASFGTYLTATAGGSASSATSETSGGTAVGGDYNYTGQSGTPSGYKSDLRPKGGSVGVAFPELHRTLHYTYNSNVILEYGDSILAYGGGGSAWGNYSGSTGNGFGCPGLPAAIIIIPLEMEE